MRRTRRGLALVALWLAVSSPAWSADWTEYRHIRELQFGGVAVGVALDTFENLNQCPLQPFYLLPVAYTSGNHPLAKEISAALLLARASALKVRLRSVQCHALGYNEIYAVEIEAP